MWCQNTHKNVWFSYKNLHQTTIIMKGDKSTCEEERCWNTMCKTKMGPLQRVAEREQNTCKEKKKKKRKKRRAGQERDGIVSGRGSVHVFLRVCHRCFTSTVAVCSRRVGRPTPVPSPRGREYCGARPAGGGCRVATIRGVQEPWRREGQC